MRDPEDALEREPTLNDVLSDPTVRALMTSDHVEAEHLRGLLQRLRTQRAQRPPSFFTSGSRRQQRPHLWLSVFTTFQSPS